MNIKSLLIASIIFIAFSPQAKDKSFGNATALEITSIYDGDTFRANIKGFPAVIGEHMSIRINGMIHLSCGVNATRRSNLLSGAYR
tara:strand:+ start:1591 stop:1848 length:258 start_codon:yes stop_codon:yes gene_type:complete